MSDSLLHYLKEYTSSCGADVVNMWRCRNTMLRARSYLSQSPRVSVINYQADEHTVLAQGRCILTYLAKYDERTHQYERSFEDCLND